MRNNMNQGKRNEPPAGLLDAVMARIAASRLRAAKIRFWSFGVIALIALIALLPAWQELQTEAAQSGFSQFSSLVFSDASTVAVYWQDFGMTLAESFPVFGVSLVLSAGFFFLFALRFMFRDMHAAFRRSNFASFA